MIRRMLPFAAVLALGAFALSCQEQADAGAVAISVTAGGFEPAEVQVPAGKPITLVFTRKTNQTCANEVVFADLNQTKELPLNKPVRIQIPARDAGTVTFACGMDMFRGKVIVQ